MMPWRDDPEMRREYFRRYRLAHPNRMKEWHAANPRREEAKARAAEWYKNNKDRGNANSATWRKKHAKKAKAIQAAYRKRNQEVCKERSEKWRKANPDRARAIVARRTAAKRNAIPGWYGELDEFVAAEAAHLAVLREKATGVKWEVDHIIPLQGRLVRGLHVWNNLQVIPMKLNRMKGNRHERSLTNQQESANLINLWREYESLRTRG